MDDSVALVAPWARGGDDGAQGDVSKKMARSESTFMSWGSEEVWSERLGRAANVG